MLPFGLEFGLRRSTQPWPTKTTTRIHPCSVGPDGIWAKKKKKALGTQLPTAGSSTLETLEMHRTSQSVSCQSWLPLFPPSISSGEKSRLERQFSIKRGDKSGCYSPKAMLITRHGTICAYNERFWSQMLSFQVVFPKQVLFTQTDLKERCHLILSLNLAPRGAAGCYSLGKDAAWYFSGEVIRKRTAVSPLPWLPPPPPLWRGSAHSQP